jgi:putative DNA primase/helicase
MAMMDGFRDAIRAAGLTPPDSIEPGRFHRFPGEGKSNGNKAGWCKLFADERGGIFGDFSTGFVESWQAAQERPLSPAERDAHRERIELTKAEAEATRREEQAQAATKAAAIWKAATPAPYDHPYLVFKGVKSHGLRLHKGRIVVPLRDAAGDLHSLQFIGEDGEKRFLSDGRVAGCYFGIGKPNGVVCIAEGYATAATIHEATGRAVAVAFSAGNLEPVARALHEKYHEITIIVCADDDYRTVNNPGVTRQPKPRELSVRCSPCRTSARIDQSAPPTSTT